MRWKVLLVFAILILCLPAMSERGTSLADYKTRTVNSFETGVNETTAYGNWSSSVYATGEGTASVTRTNTSQYHGFYSAMLSITVGNVGAAYANLSFSSNTSQGTFMWDTFGIAVRGVRVSGYYGIATYSFRQYNNTTHITTTTETLDLDGNWTVIELEPVWDSETTNFMLLFSLRGKSPQTCSLVLYVDYFYLKASEVDIRIRYWNLYTGLGYYEEKLLARYYSFPEGWIDVWRGEFQAYKGDEILLRVTDIFGRNVWTGIVEIDSDPVYVDILVPIVTVYIPEPDWYNDSVPMEWRITCLPWGPDGARGMELPALGFVFEVLAGWYSISWLESHYVQAGNQTIYIDGNITAKRSYMLANFTIPINPEYEVEIDGRGEVFDLARLEDLWKLAAALYDDERVKAVSLLLLFLAVVTLMWRARELKKIAQRQEGRT